MANKNNRDKTDAQELEEAYNSMTGTAKKASKKSGSSRTAVIIAICIALVAITVCCAAGAMYFMKAELNGIILENVTVAGVDVGGMTQTEAIDAVRAATALTYSKKAMSISVLDTNTEIPANYVGELDIKGAVKAAYKFGNSGTTSKRQQDQQIAMTTGYAVDLTPYLELNEDGIRQILADLGANYNTTLSQSTSEVTGTAPDQVLVVTLGTPEYGLDLEQLYRQVLEAYSRNEFSVEGQCGMIQPDPIDLQAILDQHYIAPTNASFNKETFEIVEGIDGYGFDIDAAKIALEQAKFGTTVEIPFTAIKPEINSEALSSVLYRDELATYTATSNSDANRDTNLQLACESINGMILYPGDVFSYNDVLGERTTQKGYKLGNSYSGNKTVKTVGGGICQVSSTLYYCVLMAELEVLVRENHSFAPSYIPLGMDATVSWGSIDFRFKNNLEYPIRIEATAEGGNTTIKLIGTSEKDYYVELEYDEISTIDYTISYETMPPNNPDGYKDGDYITIPYKGRIVRTYRCKYNSETKELISRDFIDQSSYDKRDGVICRIEETVSTPPDSGDDLGIGNGRVTE